MSARCGKGKGCLFVVCVGIGGGEREGEGISFLYEALVYIDRSCDVEIDYNE